MTANDYMEIVTPLIKEAWSDGKAGKYRDVWESWATDKADTIQKAIGHVPGVNTVELIHMIGRDCLEAWDNGQASNGALR
ncbi:hypothetical protein DWV16_05785 [Anaerotruncus sp. AF02-27]|uniref:hypothetical protein n=2 Tax=Anaerotruncus sp. AF02-27 TaxID=2292191 RepID=UPI000E4F3546|nr:hypothetical protein [Anaerotruncus sp. AF02-27]RGX55860.1 hypothetical protein DWV16_05785 [Anaerotruncus sp. AF02-27]